MGDFTSFWKKKKTKRGVIPILRTRCSIAPQRTGPAQLHGHARAGGHADGAFTGVRLPVAKTACGLCRLHLSGRGVAHPSVAPAHWSADRRGPAAGSFATSRATRRETEQVLDGGRWRYRPPFSEFRPPACSAERDKPGRPHHGCLRHRMGAGLRPRRTAASGERGSGVAGR